MDYEVKTVIDNIDDMTDIIKNQLNDIAEGFVSVGYYLRKTDETMLYKQKGYKTIYEYAKDTFGIGRSTASRFMEINQKYSKDGYSPEIDLKWSGYGSSKLTEMLGLPEDVQEAIPVDATVRDIREAKGIIRETEHNYSDQMELCDIAQPDPERNPAKTERPAPKTERLETKPAEPQTKQPDPPTKSEEIPTENEEKQTETPDTTAVPAETKEKEPEKAEETPETKTEFQQEITDETQIPGQTELIKDFPEYCPPDMNTPEQQDQSEVKPAYATRRIYIASVDADTAAEYMGKAMEKAIRNMPGVSFGVLTKESFWKEFFETEVDRNGAEIECVN